MALTSAIRGFGTTVWKFSRDLVPTLFTTPSQPLCPDRLYTQNTAEVTCSSPSHLSTLVHHLHYPSPPRSPSQEVAVKVVGGSISNINRCPPATHSPHLTFEHLLLHKLDVSGHPTILQGRWCQDGLLQQIKHHADIQQQ